MLFIPLSTCLSPAVFAQGEIIDDFSLKAMPDWMFGGVQMKYSHEQDNKENGFAEIISNKSIQPAEYIGKIMLKRPHLFRAGNFVNVMISGADNDAYVTVSILYDLDNNKRYDSKTDAALESKPFSMDFSGWKELKIRLDQENFDLKTETQAGFEVTEDEALGIQLDFSSGKNYKVSEFKSGIALVSEIQNKESLAGFEYSGKETESYFGASNSPNPFNSSTTIKYTLPSSTHVNLSVYDRLGRLLGEIVNESQESGEHSVDFTAEDLPSGIYFYRIKTPERTEVRKMILSK
ncbi:MAG: T9SS type A sorting domain-containing protein [Ignavibacteria bacterium]|nr:T9SS type A sorting domain-containing protein [Ignavibacteria bacterium]